MCTNVYSRYHPTFAIVTESSDTKLDSTFSNALKMREFLLQKPHISARGATTVLAVAS